LVSIFTLVYCCWPGAPVAADAPTALSFYASFEKNTIADMANGDEVPLQAQSVKRSREGRRGYGALLEPGSYLSYDAPGNVYAARGTVGFWWKSDDILGNVPFSLLRISQAQKSAHGFAFADLGWTGTTLRLAICDRNDLLHEINAHATFSIVAGRWYYLAFTWDELNGIQLFIDGRLAGQSLEELQLDSTLDQIAIQSDQVTPFFISPVEHRIFIDEMRIYTDALSEKDILYLSELGAAAAGNVTQTSPPKWRAGMNTGQTGLDGKQIKAC
jgi:hypothetical protein